MNEGREGGRKERDEERGGSSGDGRWVRGEKGGMPGVQGWPAVSSPRAQVLF